MPTTPSRPTQITRVEHVGWEKLTSNSLINLLSLLLLSLFPLILSPLMHLAPKSAQPISPTIDSKTREVGMWYNLLLSWPVFMVCFYVNVSDYVLPAYTCTCRSSARTCRWDPDLYAMDIDVPGFMGSGYLQKSTNTPSPLVCIRSCPCLKLTSQVIDCNLPHLPRLPMPARAAVEPPFPVV
jgi:hypothetical protein